MLFVLSLPINNTDWKLEKSIGLVKAYTANTGRPFKKIKVVSPINKAYSEVFKTYFEVSKQSTWMESILKSELLKKDDENSWYTRYEVKLPFPFKNRELVYKMTKTTLENEIQVNYVSVPNFIPKNEDFVRMTISEGYWKFTKTTATTSQVETGAYNETPGIPAWLVNLFIVDVPINSIVNFKKLIESK